MAVVHGAIEFFETVKYMLDHFEMNFPSFEEMLRMKHMWQPDKAQWKHFARLSHLQAQFKEGWDEALYFDGRGNLFRATHIKIDEITDWKLAKVEDAKAITGDAEAHMKELKEIMTRDIEAIKRVPDETEVKALQVLGNVPFISFGLDVTLPITGVVTIKPEEAETLVKRLEKRKRSMAKEIDKLQDAIMELSQVKEARVELASFFAML